jgi:3-phosphoshikimate 1-carboxyvinyltransferase
MLFASSSPTPVTNAKAELLVLEPIEKLDGVVTLPGSKSLSNRVLLLAALSEGKTRVENLLDSDDIRYMIEALQQLQVPLERHDANSITVTGQAGPLSAPASPDGDEGVTTQLFLGNAGTAMRPLAAALAFARRGQFVLDGVPRMRERPIQDLMEGLIQLGANVSCVTATGCPPVTIHAQPSSSASSKAIVSGKMSSQFLSALLMASPLAASALQQDITISIKDELISAPYVKMTVGLMKQFGVTVEVDSWESSTPTFITRKDQTTYKSPSYILVEGDASSASYFLAGAAITGGTVTVRGCGSSSVQGDVQFANVLEQMGCTVSWTTDSVTVTGPPKGTKNEPPALKGIDVDCGKIPDAAMTLAVVALFANGPTTIRNVYSWRLKETERMKAIVNECTKLGATVEEFNDYCIIHPPNKLKDNVSIQTYDDHRMAMAFSLAACGGVHVIIQDPSCTAKTFPTYFDMLASVTTKITPKI